MSDTILSFSSPDPRKETLERALLITDAIQDIINIMFHREGTDALLGSHSISLLLSELSLCLEALS